MCTFLGIIMEERCIILTILDINAKLLGGIIFMTTPVSCMSFPALMNNFLVSPCKPRAPEGKHTRKKLQLWHAASTEDSRRWASCT